MNKILISIHFCKSFLNLSFADVIFKSVLDNLVKGAAGQAVQNMNVMFGIPENTGLTQLPIYP